MVDDYSRYTWVHLLQLKSETIVAIKNFISMIKTQFGVLIKSIRSDNGTKFINHQCANLFQSLGILHQTSCPYTPQRNGVVERKHRQILNIARALNVQAHLPIRYWGLCVKAAVYLMNGCPLQS